MPLPMSSRTQTFRWKFYDPVVLWLFPVTYVLHLSEEWLSSAPIAHWTTRADRPLDGTSFIGANIVGLLLMLIGIRLAPGSTRFHWIVPALATAVLLNTGGHLLGSVSIGGYSAGLITGVILWIPLGMLTLMRVWDQASARTLVAGIIVGVVIELTVVAMLTRIEAAAGVFRGAEATCRGECSTSRGRAAARNCHAARRYRTRCSSSSRRRMSSARPASSSRFHSRSIVRAST